MAVNGTVTLTDIEPHTVTQILSYIYSSKYTLSDTIKPLVQMCKLYIAALNYSMGSLQADVLKGLIETLIKASTFADVKDAITEVYGRSPKLEALSGPLALRLHLSLKTFMQDEVSDFFEKDPSWLSRSTFKGHTGACRALMLIAALVGLPQVTRRNSSPVNRSPPRVPRDARNAEA